MAKIYVASSWSNSSQPVIVAYLRSLGHDVYDFRKPNGVLEDNVWNEKSVKDIAFPHRMTEKDFTTVCKMPVVKEKFKKHFDAIIEADICVLLLPCGASAHTEAGYMAGQGKKVIVFNAEQYLKPELMYLFFGGYTGDVDKLKEMINEYNNEQPQ